MQKSGISNYKKKLSYWYTNRLCFNVKEKILNHNRLCSILDFSLLYSPPRRRWSWPDWFDRIIHHMDAKVPPYTHTQADTYLTPSHTTLEGQAHRDRKGMRRPSVGHGNTLILHLYHPPTIPQPQKELHPSARTICTHARRFIAMQRCISVH